MNQSHKIEILKQALLLEKRGQAFYQKVAEHTEHHAVKKFFSLMAEEERKHIQALLKQYHFLKDSGDFGETESGFFEDLTQTAEEVLTKDIVEKIANSDYESAAIAAAINMEEKAVKIYSERAAKSDDVEEKRLYDWLAKWEQKHLNELMMIDESITEKIWLDNNFWPF
ncbi:MAG: hypothetical protein PWR01_4068 [Clostridiales bacterium]|nr:hypothetical protein [Clostridiales bacterium]MDN5282995.1 hypothetical protein [Candidatus Ozemobacter sp.]